MSIAPRFALWAGDQNLTKKIHFPRNFSQNFAKWLPARGYVRMANERRF
jgi:hypothetical protein